MSSGNKIATYQSNGTDAMQMPDLTFLTKGQLRKNLEWEYKENHRLKTTSKEIIFENVKLRKEKLEMLTDNLSLQRRITELEQQLLSYGGQISPLQIAAG